MSDVYISEKAYPETLKYLSDGGYALHLVRERKCAYTEISSHPDVYHCLVGGELVSASGAPEDPREYNAVCLDRFLLHNLKFTAPEILKKARDSGKAVLNVKQGFTKCSTLIVDGEAVITSDRGIEKTLFAAGVSVLLISPGNVLLPGYEYGFIGGTAGRVGRRVVFNGGLDTHPEGDAIRGFIEARGIEIADSPGLPLADIGSILCLKEKIR